MKLSMNLIKRKNGVYYVVWREDGKQYWRSLRTKDKALARRLFNQFKKAYLQGKLIRLEDQCRRIRLSEFGEEYFAWLEKAREQGTYKQYRIAWDKLIQTIGDILLPDVNRKHIDLFVQNQLANNSPVTVNKDLRSLRSIFNTAVRWEYITKSPLEKYSLLKIDERPPRALSDEEIIRLLSAIDDFKFRLLVAFILYSGCRREEALKLTWDKIDMKNRRILIEKTKTHRSRYIPISDSLKAVLEKVKVISPVGKLFPFWTPDWVSKKFSYYAKKAGIKKCRLHDLRHTFATHLLSSGVPIKVLQELLGHQSLQSTMVYLHALEDAKREAMEKLQTGLELIK